MRINLRPFEELEKNQEKLRLNLCIPADVHLDIALDGVHALNEVTRSLADLHPHKRSIALIDGQPPPLREMGRQFAGQGFVVQHLPFSFVDEKFSGFGSQISFGGQISPGDKKSFDEAFASLKKDTLFILSAQVEPFTGALYPIARLRNEAAKRGIFLVVYQSPDALNGGMIKPTSPTEVIVADPLWGEEGAVALILRGERAKGEKIIWGESVIPDRGIKRLVKSLSIVGEAPVTHTFGGAPVTAVTPAEISAEMSGQKQSSGASGIEKYGQRPSKSKKKEGDPNSSKKRGQSSNKNKKQNEDSIAKFEEQVRKNFSYGVQTLPLFLDRYYDRAAFFVDGVNGDALVHELKKSKISATTAAACFWNDPHMNPWLLELGLSPEMIQGSLIIPLQEIRKAKTIAALTRALKKLRKISGYALE